MNDEVHPFTEQQLAELVEETKNDCREPYVVVEAELSVDAAKVLATFDKAKRHVNDVSLSGISDL